MKYFRSAHYQEIAKVASSDSVGVAFSGRDNVRHWRIAAVLVATLALSSIMPIATTGFAQEQTSDGLELWLDSRPSDAPLRGQDVVHRPSSDMPDFRSADFSKTWTLVIDGKHETPGVRSYSLGFEEPVKEATPKVYSMAAVDLSTCQVEFTVGIPTKPEIPDIPGMRSETVENGSADEKAAQQPLEERAWQGYMFPGSLLLQDVGGEGQGQIRYAVYGEWKDPAQIVVNQVLSAVKARVANNDKLSHYHCRHQREWREQTGWQNRSTGQWDDTDCNEANYSIKSTTSARFYNEDFVLCQPNGYAWVYYDRLSARASTSTSNWTYQFNIVSTWAAGVQCDSLLHWGNFHTYPGEYNTLDPL